MDARDYLFEKHLQDDDEIALAAFLWRLDHEEEGGYDEEEGGYDEEEGGHDEGKATDHGAAR